MLAAERESLARHNQDEARGARAVGARSGPRGGQRSRHSRRLERSLGSQGKRAMRRDGQFRGFPAARQGLDKDGRGSWRMTEQFGGAILL